MGHYGVEERRTDISPRPATVSRILLARHDRQELYERVWRIPIVKLEKEFGISDSVLRERLRRLIIPVPGLGYWQKKSANKPVEPRPPLPAIQVRRCLPIFNVAELIRR